MPFAYELNSNTRGARSLDRETTTQQRTAQGLLRLRSALAEQVPKRTINETLLLATWNIRDFDSAKYGYRSDEAMYYIAEIISYFDLVAIQEVNANLEALDRLVEILGSWWKYLITDVTTGRAGNQERAAFVYDTRKVKFGGLAGEIVIPDKKLKDKTLQPQRQLARSPFLCGFEAGYLRFSLCTVHIFYGGNVADDPTRLEEVRTLSEYLVKHVENDNSWARNLVLLGDFNIFSTEDQTFKAMIDAGFYIPPQFAEMTSNAAEDKHFDQIAFVSRAYDEDVVLARIAKSRAGVFNFYDHVYRLEDAEGYADEIGPAYRTRSTGQPRTTGQKQKYYKDWRSHQMSDHFPMWIELQVDFGEDYLREVAGNEDGGSGADSEAGEEDPGFEHRVR
ncbi:MAG: endonuclease/exonuclease/phosphatase family protein [Planctomycetaceae bacterium]|nr:endonuclease/exonuclease/phosphatase family protein [Planctomycetaceae bacterium]